MALRRAWVVQQLGSVVWAFGVGRLGERLRSAAPGFDDDFRSGETEGTGGPDLIGARGVTEPEAANGDSGRVRRCVCEHRSTLSPKRLVSSSTLARGHRVGGVRRTR